ncbi:hypothetical protein BH09SUM1_BH09SUM1_31190 [soil metagenome]
MAFRSLFLTLLLLLAAVRADAVSGTINSLAPTTIATFQTTALAVEVKNTGTGSTFWIDVTNISSGLSISNPAEHVFLSSNKKKIFSIDATTNQNLGDFNLTVRLMAENEYGDTVQVTSNQYTITAINVPGSFTIYAPIFGQQLDGPYGVAWNISPSATTYDLTIARDIGGVPQTPPAFQALGMTDTFVSLNTSTLVKGAFYHVDVVAKNVVGMTSNSNAGLMFQVKPAPLPGLFDITSPTTNQTVEMNPTFTWTQSANAVSYTIDILPEENGVPVITPVREVTGITSLSYAWADPPLTGGRNYYVSVRAFGQSDSILNQSGAVKFFVTALSPFSLGAPSNGAENVTHDTDFTWEAVGAATYYTIYFTKNTPSGVVLWYSTNVAPQFSVVHFKIPASQFFTAGGTFNWGVRAFSATEFRDNTAGFRTFNFSPIGPFELIDPANGATSVPTRPLFNWNACSGATRYRVDIVLINPDGTPNVGSLHQSPIITTGPQWQANYDLILGTRYGWRVLASNDYDTAFSYGTYQQFAVTSLVGQPTLLSPADDVTVTPYPELVWNSVQNAVFYRIYININGEYNLPAFEIYPPNLAVNLGTIDYRLNGNTHYFWTVEAVGPDGSSSFAPSARAFTTTERSGFDKRDFRDHLLGRQRMPLAEINAAGRTKPFDATSIIP